MIIMVVMSGTSKNNRDFFDRREFRHSLKIEMPAYNGAAASRSGGFTALAAG
jgi:hypothetical protein